MTGAQVTYHLGSRSIIALSSNPRRDCSGYALGRGVSYTQTASRLDMFASLV